MRFHYSNYSTKAVILLFKDVGNIPQTNLILPFSFLHISGIGCIFAFVK